MRQALLLSAALVAVSACAQFPEVDARQTRADPDAPYPVLLPLSELDAALPAPSESGAEDLDARAAALRARAAAIAARGVVSSDEKDRLQKAVERNAP